MDALSNELHQLLLERKDAQERGDVKKMEQVNMKIQQSGYMVRIAYILYFKYLYFWKIFCIKNIDLCY